MSGSQHGTHVYSEPQGLAGSILYRRSPPTPPRFPASATCRALRLGRSQLRIRKLAACNSRCQSGSKTQPMPLVQIGVAAVKRLSHNLGNCYNLKPLLRKTKILCTAAPSCQVAYAANRYRACSQPWASQPIMQSIAHDASRSGEAVQKSLTPCLAPPETMWGCAGTSSSGHKDALIDPKTISNAP